MPFEGEEELFTITSTQINLKQVIAIKQMEMTQSIIDYLQLSWDTHTLYQRAIQHAGITSGTPPRGDQKCIALQTKTERCEETHLLDSSFCQRHFKRQPFGTILDVKKHSPPPVVEPPPLKKQKVSSPIINPYLLHVHHQPQHSDTLITQLTTTTTAEEEKKEMSSTSSSDAESYLLP